MWVSEHWACYQFSCFCLLVNHEAYHDLPSNICLSVFWVNLCFFLAYIFRHLIVRHKPKICSFIRLMPWHRFAMIRLSWKHWSTNVNHFASNTWNIFFLPSFCECLRWIVRIQVTNPFMDDCHWIEIVGDGKKAFKRWWMMKLFDLSIWFIYQSCFWLRESLIHVRNGCNFKYVKPLTNNNII